MKCVLVISTIFVLSGCLGQRSHQPDSQLLLVHSGQGTGEIPVTKFYKETEQTPLALDIYLPKQTEKAAKLAIWIHGGAWMRGSKDETLPKNGNLIRALLQEGIAVAAVNYRLSGQAIYPAALQDINDAINYLSDNSTSLQIDTTSVLLMGRSAGAHLAALLGTSNNQDAPFLETAPQYKVAGVVDFFGPSNLNELKGNSGKVDHDAPDAAEALFLGVSPRVNVPLALEASPTTYIDPEDPPFIIFHGEKDRVVPASQSKYLSMQLSSNGVVNSLHLDESARHGDRVFDSQEYVLLVVEFVKKTLDK